MKFRRVWLFAGMWGTSATAQVVFDGSIGPSAGALVGPGFLIPADRGAIAGGNLFHSFSDFNLSSGQSATFTGPASVNNILARVTGGPSSIRGAIHSDIPGANLFLMNPAGIVFGPGASVNVSGAFRTTTADFIGMADGAQFQAIPDGTSVLTSAAPEAFGFQAGSGHAGEVRMEYPMGATVSGLNFSGSDASFVGRRVVLRNAFLKSAGGEISLTAVGDGEADVAIAIVGREASLTGDLQGEVSLSNASLSVSRGDDGEVIVRGGDVSIQGAGIGFVQVGGDFDVFNGIDADAKGTAAGGNVRIQSNGDIRMGGNSRVASFSRNDQDGGTLTFDAMGDIRLATGADVVASSVAGGDGGVIDMRAANLMIDGTGATRSTRLSAQSNSTATGAGGSIRVDVPGAVEIKAGGAIATNTLSSGRGGDISIHASSMFLSRDRADVASTGIEAGSAIPTNPVLLSGYGDAGNITVNVAGDLVIEDAAMIQSITSSDGQGGTIRVNAGSLSIAGAMDGLDRDNAFLTGIAGLTTLRAAGGIPAGRGGDVFVNVAGDVNLVSGGLIDSSSLGRGAGGDVSVVAGRIMADRSGSDFFTGIGSDTELNVEGISGPVAWNAGNVVVVADFVSLSNGALISSSTAGNGNAGNVSVETGILRASGFGSPTAFVFSTGSGVVAGTRGAADGKAASTGDGGTVRVVAGEEIVLSRFGEIAARADGGGEGGTVDVVVPDGRMVLEYGGRVSSSSDLAGDAGDIVMRGQHLIMSYGGRIESANTGTGDAGGVSAVFKNIDADEGEVSVNSDARDAGTLELIGESGVTLRNTSVTANAGNDGGNIVLGSGGLIFLRGSKVSADAGGGGGNITFEGARHLVLDGTSVSASAVERDGGNIFVSTGTFFANDSPLSVTSERGAPGTIRIETLDVLDGGIEQEEPELLNPDDVLQPTCSERAPDVGSSFTRAGKGSTPRLPGGFVPSFRIVE